MNFDDDEVIDASETFAKSNPISRHDPSATSRAVGSFHDFQMSDEFSGNNSSTSVEEEYGIDDDGLPNTSLRAGPVNNNKRSNVSRGGRLSFVLSYCKRGFALVVVAVVIVLSGRVLSTLARGLSSSIDNPVEDAATTMMSSILDTPLEQPSDTTALNISYTEEELLRLSERIVEACDEQKLDEDMAPCQHLCKNVLCCFEEERQYNCWGERPKLCLAHAACRELVSNDYSMPRTMEAERLG